MGFYCSVSIKTKDNCFTLYTQKGGIGLYVLAFNDIDYTVDIKNHLYNAKTDINNASKRIQKVYSDFIDRLERNKAIGLQYDEWSQKAIKKELDFFENTMDKFKSLKSDDIIYANMNDASDVYDNNNEVDVNIDKKHCIEYIKNIVDGCYIGKYPSNKEYETARNFIKKFKDEIKNCNAVLDIQNVGTTYDPTFFTVGDKRLIKFCFDLKLSNCSIKNNYNIVDEVMIPLRKTFLSYGCDYERDYNAAYVMDTGRIRINIYKNI